MKPIPPTRIIDLTHLGVLNNNCLLAKVEFENPTGSLYDRVYPTLFRLAQQAGYIVQSKTPVIEASTGNAGAAFAFTARSLGYHDYTVVTHRDTPGARVVQMRRLGAKIVFSPPNQYARGYVEHLEQILAEDKNRKGGRIGTNPHRLYCVTKINRAAHRCCFPIVDEILAAGVKRIDYFVGVVGSGVSLSGIGQRLKHFWPAVKVIAVDPLQCPTTWNFINNLPPPNGPKAVHTLWGGSAFGLPQDKLNIDLTVIDKVNFVSEEDWTYGTGILETGAGLKCGWTSGAVVSKALELAHSVHSSTILIVLYDSAWKYGQTL